MDGSRRNKMLYELRFERNVSIHVSNMDAYREDLTKLLRRAKVILNIHAYPAKVLEICRILEAISFDIVVCAFECYSSIINQIAYSTSKKLLCCISHHY